MSRRWPAVAVLVLVILFSTWARLARLGASELWIDEYYHYFAAEAIARGDGPVLPSGEPYTRGIDISRLAAATLGIVDDPVVAARLPAALFGVANVLIFAAIAWRLAGVWAAVWAVILLGTYPAAVEEARNARFYTEQLNAGLIALWFGWLVVRAPPDEQSRRGIARQWLPIVLTGVALLAGMRIQPTTLSVAGGFAAALSLAALIDARVLGRSALRRSARVQAVVLGGVALLGIVVARPNVVEQALALARHVPLWAQGGFSPLAYYWHFSATEPLLIMLAPALLLLVAWRDPRLAGYLALWFGVPLVLHSLLFRFQAERYVLLAVPALLLIGALGLERASGIAYRAMRREFAAGRLADGAARGIAAAVVAVCALVLVGTSPAFTFTRKAGAGVIARAETNWRTAGEVMQKVPGSDSIPWGTKDPLASLFHWRRADFTIYRGFLERPALPGDVRGGRVLYEDGVPDYYSGAPVLTTPEAIRGHFASRGAVLIAVDSAYAADARSALLDTLRRSAVELCAGQCGPMRVYHWRFGYR